MLKKTAGFTLIELVIVMAITSLLALIAIAGQGALQDQARFNNAIDKLTSTVAEAYDEATAGVNTTAGPAVGTGITACPGGPAGQYVFAGVAWTADNSLTPGNGSPIELEYYEALPGTTTACVFQTQVVSTLGDMTVSVGALPGERELFVRTATGGMQACPARLTDDAAAVFAAGTCTSADSTLTFNDSSGHQSQVQIGTDGMAKRLN